MCDTQLLQMALGLTLPWQVARCAFDDGAKRLAIYLDFPRGSRFACPECGGADGPTYDTDEMTWRRLNFFQHEAYLHARCHWSPAVLSGWACRERATAVVSPCCSRHC